LYSASTFKKGKKEREIMQISVFGTGYVGLVTGVCFSEMGNDVTCADIDKNKIAKLNDGISPIYEPGLDNLITNNIQAKRIQFTTDLKSAVEKSDLLFIAVGTPSDVDGSADLKYVLSVAETIAEHMQGYKLVVTKSTVPVGTYLKVKERMQATLKKRGKNFEFDVASNPEFLREGAAIEDCLKPSRVVVGVESEKAATTLKRIYDPFLKSGNPILVMDPLSSEMTKYAANAMLATKISLMNEFSRLCDKVGADIENVRRGIGSDPRIGPHFIYAGVGYGGSCFPKDVRALIYTGREKDERLEILESVENVNIQQRKNFYNKIQNKVGGFKDKTVAVWGIAFKPGTDDIREAPAIDIMDWVMKEGGKVQAYDPVAAENAKTHFNNSKALSFFEDQYDCLKNADVLVIVTEWKSFREPNFKKMKDLMKKSLIFDGRNIYHADELKEANFEYISIGRPS
jgi:UDPglucose 6-dehydrogenase